MTDQHADMRERNRELIAQRLGWPADAVSHCRAIERRFPYWIVWFNTGGTVYYPDPVYVASLQGGHRGDRVLHAPTPEQLIAQLEETNQLLVRQRPFWYL